MNRSKDARLETKKELISFKVNGQSGEFEHLINHRRVQGANSSMLAFETCLRSYDSKVKHISRRSKTDAEQPASLVRPQFSSLPKVDRGEFPQFVVTAKEAEKLKKSNAFYTKPGIIRPAASPSGKQTVTAL